MYPCSSCHRHLREDDTTCPFCGTRQRAEGSPLVSIGAFVLVAAATLGSVACSTQPSSSDEGMTTTTASGSGTESESGTESTTETESSDWTGDGDGDMTNATTSPSLSFYAGADEDFWGLSECDPFMQDCPEGEKCVPYSSTDAGLDANKCVPITGDGEAGEPCTYGGVVEGTDDCGATSHCWYVQEVDNMLIGVCTEFCQGTPDDPICDQGQTCLIGWDGSVSLCLATCDPLLQDCPVGQMCSYHTGLGAAFACLSEPDFAAELGEPCDPRLGPCAAGLHCAPAESLVDCNGTACCAELCDTSDMNFMCTDPNYTCGGFFEDPVPAGYEDVGICVVGP